MLVCKKTKKCLVLANSEMEEKRKVVSYFEGKPPEQEREIWNKLNCNKS